MDPLDLNGPLLLLHLRLGRISGRLSVVRITRHRFLGLLGQPVQDEGLTAALSVRAVGDDLNQVVVFLFDARYKDSLNNFLEDLNFTSE